MSKVVPVALLAMMGAFGALVVVNYDGDSAAAEAPRREAEVVAAKPSATKTEVEKAPPPAPPLARALRTVSLGAEFIAPGVIANDGGTAGKTSAYKLVGVDASFASAASMDEIESSLAKGGGVAGGADIAIMPLSSYVASYERLRALAPELIFVVGWSRGREAIYGSDARAITRLPTSGQIKMAAAAAQPETFLALFMLDLAGVPASRIELVGKEVKAPLTAVFRTSKEAPKGKLLVTSADMPHVMPIVAVAPHGFIAAHEAELETWGRVWLSGVERLQADVPAGGRKVAEMSGAPPVLSIIEALGQIEFASLRENATAMGLSGRGALTLDEIFRTTWRIWRDTGALSTPPPEIAPLHTKLVASLVRTAPNPQGVVEPTRARTADAGKRPEVLLVVKAASVKAGKLDAEAFVNQIGFLAGVFDRLRLRIGLRDDAKTAQLLSDMARDRFGLRPDQLSAGRQSAGGIATIEVLAPN